jgi:cytochrome c-type biogenesis protein CcmH
MVALWFAGATHAFTPEHPLENPAQEAAAQSLFHALRCVVCEGQSLAESDATLARQMRSEIRRMLDRGQTESEVKTFFQTRYGDAVLMSPPLTSNTYILWGAPLILLAAGITLMLRRKE